jgi:hypothetical protein
MALTVVLAACTSPSGQQSGGKSTVSSQQRSAVPSHRDYWPTNGWCTAPPKAQGMDPAVLAAIQGTVHVGDGRYHQPGPPSLHLRGPTASPPGAAQTVGVDQLELTEEFAFRDGELLVGEEPLGAKLAELLQPIDWVSRRESRRSGVGRCSQAQGAEHLRQLQDDVWSQVVEPVRVVVDGSMRTLGVWRPNR